MPHLDDFLKITNFKLTVTDDNTEATVYTDGLQFTDYDLKTMCPLPHAMVNFIQSTSVVAHQTVLDSSGRTFRDIKQVNEGKIPVYISSRLQLYKPLYDLRVSKNPISVKFAGVFVGNKTAGHRSTMYTQSGEVLCTNDALVVCVDRSTGKPVPVPEWWKQKYTPEKIQWLDVNSLRIKKLDPPDNALKSQAHVTGSDIDLNNHTNWSNYVKYAEDAIYHFTQRGQCQGHIGSGMVKEVELLYGGETFEGDVLDVLVWKSEKNVLVTQIYKESTFIFQCRFQYFDQGLQDEDTMPRSKL